MGDDPVQNCNIHASWFSLEGYVLDVIGLITEARLNAFYVVTVKSDTFLQLRSTHVSPF